MIRKSQVPATQVAMIDQANHTRLHSLDFLNAGLSIVPLRLDGSKAATVPWTTYQKRLPTPGEIEHWFQQEAGAAVVCGVVSGGLEVLDFDRDAETTFPAWSAMVDPILVQLPVVETPSGGFHVYYRCNEICGNQKIAMPIDGGKPFIESRGEGGYIVTVISPPSVHALNHEYIQVAGPVLPEVTTITPDQRKELWTAAASFDDSNLRGKCVRQQRAAWNAKYLPRVRTDSQSVDSARKYIRMMKPAISGSGGHDQTFKVACILIRKFGLSECDALSLIHEYNERCDPPWQDWELRHKVNDAIKQQAA